MQKHKKLIFEDVDVSSIELAIKKRQPIYVNYIADDNDREKGSGWRIIQPVAYGLSKSGNPVIRAYQPFGDTKTKVPHWKLFRTDKFETWRPVNKKTNIPEPPLDEYNPNGDKTMSTVFLNADYAGAKQRYERGGLQRYNQQRHAEKIAQNPYYDLQKNIERSERMPTPDYITKNIENWQERKPDVMSKWLNGASADEMSRTTDFGDNSYVQTDEPIKKGVTNQAPQQTSQQSNVKKDYQNIAMQGPVNKGDEKIKQQNFEDENNIEDENNNTQQ